MDRKIIELKVLEEETNEEMESRKRRIWEKFRYYDGSGPFFETDDWHFYTFTKVLRDFENGKDVRGRVPPNNKFMRLLKGLNYISKLDSNLRDVAVFTPSSGYTVLTRCLCEKFEVDRGKLLALRISYGIFFREGSETRGRYGLAKKGEDFLYTVYPDLRKGIEKDSLTDLQLERYLQVTV